ncbi:Tspear [Symbiodinium sp. CCMP2592]|nr:Tspear [Symbiodinium sp. CCMP2592]
MSCCSRPVLFLVLAWAMVCQSYRFVELQDILTNGAVAWEPFSMAGIQYLLVTNHFTDSKIYKWDDAHSTFLEIQRIPTKRPYGSTAFYMDGIQHLVVANHYDGSSYNTDSKIYRWDNVRSTFLEMQSIPTKGAFDWAAFSIDGIQHLAVANFYDGSSNNINSKVYRWDDANSTFLEMQSIPTQGALGLAAFAMDGIQHLAVTNHHDGSSYNLNSVVYKWDNASSTFLEMQSIPAKGARGWAAFSMDGIQHLAVANMVDSTGSLRHCPGVPCTGDCEPSGSSRASNIQCVRRCELVREGRRRTECLPHPSQHGAPRRGRHSRARHRLRGLSVLRWILVRVVWNLNVHGDAGLRLASEHPATVPTVRIEDCTQNGGHGVTS